MGFPKIIYSLILLSIIFSTNSFPQIIFKELPGYQLNISDSSFFSLSETRRIIPLNGKWLVYPSEEENPVKAAINVPSFFKGDAELIFEKSFNIKPEEASQKKLKLFFLGLNYFADISINEKIIYRHNGGEYPFVVEVPRDVIKAGNKNLLSVRLDFRQDSRGTIPVKQKFLFPGNYGGIIRDVYLYLEPNISIKDFNFSIGRENRTNNVQLRLWESIENREFKRMPDTLAANEFEISAALYNPEGTLSAQNTSMGFQLKMNQDRKTGQVLEISDPAFWFPGSPNLYSLEISLMKNGVVIDKVIKEFPLYFLSSADDALTLNGQSFAFRGTTYIPSFGEHGSLASFGQMESDIKLIAETGFNSVRFAKSVPHPYYLRLCEKYGLLALIEIPINSVPANICSDQEFISKCKNYLTEFIIGYSRFGSFAAIGLGSSFLPQVQEHYALINELETIIPRQKGLLSYASFAGLNLTKVNNLDLYGIELTGKTFAEDTITINLLAEDFGKGKLFISEASYFVNNSRSGYINENTYDAQGKYFEEFLTAFPGNNTSGYFINTMFDYRGEFSTLLSGYKDNKVINTGLISENRKTMYPAYKVIKAELKNSERITIPIGTKKDDAPMIFIVVGLALALIVGVLVNSGRKFREDASRALLRPYNFYADIRDQRIISSYHSTVMAFVIVIVNALVISSLLYYLKDNIVFEKILLSFGSAALMENISYLAWNPFEAILWLSVLSGAMIIALVIIIKFASFFVKNRVYISSVYFTVVWAFIPLVLLVPAGIVLYRALDAGSVNLYVYIAFLIFGFWIFYRLVKGIYVIFDVNPGQVYMYSLMIVVVLITTLLLYYEVKNSFVDYLLLVFKQYNISELI